MTWAEEIKAYRRELQLTQEGFAAVYGVPRRTLQDWEHGAEPPPWVQQLLRRVLTEDLMG